MPEDLAKQVVIVTGAGSGIGRGIAVEMAARGARVAALDLDGATAEETAALIVKAGGKVMAVQGDTSRADDVDRAVTTAVKELGPLDVMVNNAGILDGYFDVDEMDERLWRRVIDIDLTGVFLGCRRALAEMLPRRRGRIVNMASVAGLNGTGGGAAYVAAKHGVVGLTRQMAVTYGARGITVNAVCPGPILTGLRQHSQAILGPDVPDMSGRGVAVNDEQVRAIVPAGRRGTVADIAGAVCYLASADADYVNGHTLVVDGGWRAR
ncbi:MAG TPA: SDR family NAD(P)-dependent oxidoreductase [Candidatus Limnocylindrales bacterium]|nr:SDR family NAD(P)-dependent oxidoreductase [Candidatus Limnocylindrales bacterium]